MADYYAKRLSGERLRHCYSLASPRVRQYLEAEIWHLMKRTGPDATVLELGCGYGRVAHRLAAVARRVVGIDTAIESLEMGVQQYPEVNFCAMDALELGFPDASFDITACIQNGICAFGVDPERLIREAMRVTRPGGTAYFSTYDDRFWRERLAWFEDQAREGLLGPVDHEASGRGTIVCRDGFRAGRLLPEALGDLAERVGASYTIREIDESSVFLEIRRLVEASTQRP